MTFTFSGGTSHSLRLTVKMLKAVRNPYGISTTGLASSAFARHYLRNLGWCLFLALLRCFSSGSSLPAPIWFSTGYMDMSPCGFPHSEICGSKLICSSPQLIAAYHVFHRLPVPRHSPCALIRLTVFTDFRSEAVTRFSWFFFAHACFILRKYIKYSLTLQLRLNKKSSSKSSFLRSSRKSNPLILHLPTKKFSVFEIAVSNYIYFLSFAVTIQFSRCKFAAQIC